MVLLFVERGLFIVGPRLCVVPSGEGGGAFPGVASSIFIVTVTTLRMEQRHTSVIVWWGGELHESIDFVPYCLCCL